MPRPPKSQMMTLLTFWCRIQFMVSGVETMLYATVFVGNDALGSISLSATIFMARSVSGADISRLSFTMASTNERAVWPDVDRTTTRAWLISPLALSHCSWRAAGCKCGAANIYLLSRNAHSQIGFITPSHANQSHFASSSRFNHVLASLLM